MSKRKRQRGSAPPRATGEEQLPLGAQPGLAEDTTVAAAGPDLAPVPLAASVSAAPPPHVSSGATLSPPVDLPPEVASALASTPFGEMITPPTGDLPLMADTSPSGDFPTIGDDSTPVRTRLRRFATPLPRASTTPQPAPRVPPPIRPPPTRIELPPGTEVTGDLLRQLREQRGVSLKEIEEVTRVRALSLAAVEAEKFDDLPDVKIYIRGFVQALARAIGLDVELASASYLARWERWRERTPAPKRHFLK